MEESEVVSIMRSFLENLLDVTSVGIEFCPNTNCCKTDLRAYSEDKIKYLVECKGSLKPGGIAGGIGQAYQYYYQRKYSKSVFQDAKIYFACPYDMKKYLDYMNIPHEINAVYLVKKDGQVVLYKRTKSMKVQNQIQLKGTFFIEGIKIGLIKEVILLLGSLEEEKRNRKYFGKMMHKKYPSLSANTHTKNSLIPLRDLGLVQGFNLTPEGYKIYLAIKESDKKFKGIMVEKFFPFIINIINAILQHSKDTNQKIDFITFNQKDLEKKISDIYGAEVRFFDVRRLSYGLQILEEIGAIKKIIKGGKKGYEIIKITNF